MDQVKFDFNPVQGVKEWSKFKVPGFMERTFGMSLNQVLLCYMSQVFSPHEVCWRSSADSNIFRYYASITHPIKTLEGPFHTLLIF